jgi:hypothetical protein
MPQMEYRLCGYSAQISASAGEHFDTEISGEWSSNFTTTRIPQRIVAARHQRRYLAAAGLRQARPESVPQRADCC